MYLFAQASLGTNAKAIFDDQHPNHEFWVDRRSAGVAVKRREILAQIGEVEKLINAAKKVIGGDVILEIEPRKTSGSDFRRFVPSCEQSP
jgi:hypothetical protein